MSVLHRNTHSDEIVHNTLQNWAISKIEFMVLKRQRLFWNTYYFQRCTLHLDTNKVFYLPTDAQYSCFKRILKFLH